MGEHAAGPGGLKQRLSEGGIEPTDEQVKEAMVGVGRIVRFADLGVEINLAMRPGERMQAAGTMGDEELIFPIPR